jgi:hypothetical protein
VLVTSLLLCALFQKVCWQAHVWQQRTNASRVIVASLLDCHSKRVVVTKHRLSSRIMSKLDSYDIANAESSTKRKEFLSFEDAESAAKFLLFKKGIIERATSDPYKIARGLAICKQSADLTKPVPWAAFAVVVNTTDRTVVEVKRSLDTPDERTPSSSMEIYFLKRESDGTFIMLEDPFKRYVLEEFQCPKRQAEFVSLDSLPKSAGKLKKDFELHVKRQVDVKKDKLWEILDAALMERDGVSSDSYAADILQLFTERRDYALVIAQNSLKGMAIPLPNNDEQLRFAKGLTGALVSAIDDDGDDAFSRIRDKHNMRSYMEEVLETQSRQDRDLILELTTADDAHEREKDRLRAAHATKKEELEFTIMTLNEQLASSQNEVEKLKSVLADKENDPN